MELYQNGTLDTKINHLTAKLEELQVRKLRQSGQSGKYSGRYRGEGSSKESKEVCPCCTYDHSEIDRCPAVGALCKVKVVLQGQEDQEDQEGERGA